MRGNSKKLTTKDFLLSLSPSLISHPPRLEFFFFLLIIGAIFSSAQDLFLAFAQGSLLSVLREAYGYQEQNWVCHVQDSIFCYVILLPTVLSLWSLSGTSVFPFWSISCIIICIKFVLFFPYFLLL